MFAISELNLKLMVFLLSDSMLLTGTDSCYHDDPEVPRCPLTVEH